MDRKYIHPNRRDNQFTVNDTLELCKSIVSSINSGRESSPYSRAIESGDYMSLIGGGFDTTVYARLDHDKFYQDYISYNILRKFPDLPGVNVDRKTVALNALLSAELSCKAANQRLTRLRSRPEEYPDVSMVLYHARRKIASVLGDFDWNSVIDEGDFGPGASTRLSRDSSSLYNKVQGALHLTGPLLPLFKAFQAYKPGLFEDFTVVEGNKITFVPKDAKTDRPIAIEPDFNMWVQKAIGSSIRSKLRRRTKERIDLNDQTHNQLLAKLASLGFGLATVDLSSASDTISYSLVEMLVPDDWLNALSMTRSSVGTLPDGTKIRYRKWSSMGNGYTFELESLIFWALCKGVIEVFGDGSEYVSVYGDDIVLSSHLYPALVEVFSFVGFTINDRKSFHEGFFYESCGKHFFNGRDVTPLYVDKVPHRIAERIALANEIQLLAWRYGHQLYRCTSFRPAFNSIVKTLPAWLQRPRAPLSCKGNAIIGDFDECCPQRNVRGEEGYRFLGLTEFNVPLYSHIDAGTLKTSLYILEYRSYRDGTPSVAVAKSKKMNGRKLIAAREWSYLGPWI